MLVKCPNCNTTYKVSDEVLKGTTPAFRCSRCKHTFELRDQGGDHDNPPSEAGAHQESNSKKSLAEELSFTFARREPKENSAPENEEDSLPHAAQVSPAPGSHEFGEPWAMAQVEDHHEMPYTISAPSEWEKDEVFVDPQHDTATEDHLFEPLVPRAEDDDNVFPLDPYRDQQTSTLPYMTLFALLIICFSVLTALQITYPEASQAVVKRFPLLGTALVRNSHLKNGLALKSIQGSYQTIQGNRKVFVVTGIALNQNPVLIREVRIAGHTYSEDGKSIEEQSIWVGNALSPKIIRGMTPQDISDLQRLKPLKSFEIPPGDSMPFTIVFLKPAKAIKEFSCEVLGAEGEV